MNLQDYMLQNVNKNKHNQIFKSVLHYMTRKSNYKKNCAEYEYPRPFFSFLKTVLNKTEVIGAEIGVFRGGNAKNILETLCIREIYLIDPYKNVQGWFDDWGNSEEVRKQAVENLRFYKKKIIWLYKESRLAAREIKKQTLDFVYVDGNHYYDYVRQDLELYYPLIKPGGYMGGHDYYLFDNLSTAMEVKLAVDEFTQQHKLGLIVSTGIVPDWWFQKPL